MKNIQSLKLCNLFITPGSKSLEEVHLLQIATSLPQLQKLKIGRSKFVIKCALC